MLKHNINIDTVFTRWAGRPPTKQEVNRIFDNKRTAYNIYRRTVAGNRLLTSLEIHRLCDILGVTRSMLEMNCDVGIKADKGVLTVTIKNQEGTYTLPVPVDKTSVDFYTDKGYGGVKILDEEGEDFGFFPCGLKEALSSFLFKAVSEINRINKEKG